MIKPIQPTKLRSLTASTLAVALLGFSLAANAVTFKVDSAGQNWEGFLNVTGTNGFVDYFFGSDWALPDVRAEFIKTNANAFPLNDIARQLVNTNNWNPADPYWVTNGVANKFVEANFFVNIPGATNIGGQTVTFEGTVYSNNIPSVPFELGEPIGGLPADNRWEVTAVVKEFTETFGFLNIQQVDLPASGPFTVSLPIGPNNRAQFGFIVYGPITAPGSAEALTSFAVAVEDSDPAISLQPEGGDFTLSEEISLTSGAVGSTALTFQWQKDGANVADGGTLSGATTTNLVISSGVTADSGDYTFIATGSGGSVTSAVAAVTVVPVLITNQPNSVRAPVGADVVFEAGAFGEVLARKWQYQAPGETNWLNINFPGGQVNIPNASGTETDTLTLSGVQLTNTGNYRLRFVASDSSLVFTEPANLLVKTPADYVNFLENSGFENGKDIAGVETNETPWLRFENTDPFSGFGAVQDASDTYFLGGNVNIYEGTYVSFSSFAATWNGIYQDVIAEPGQKFTADMWFYNASGDPLPGPADGATNESYLEVQFRNDVDGNDGVIQQYTTDIGALNYLTVKDTWINLAATNAGDFGFDSANAVSGPILTAPEGTTKVRFQVTMNDQGGSVDIGGSLYYDLGSLRLTDVAILSISDAGGGTVDVSWDTQLGLTYEVQTKIDLTTGTWTTLETVEGTGSTVTKNYPSTGTRFYRVETQ